VLLESETALEARGETTFTFRARVDSGGRET